MTAPKIVVVGAGPVGLTTAILLRLRGYEPIIVDRKPDTTHLPAAHVVSPRSMEIFREAGVDRAIIDAAGGRTLIAEIVWCESVAGRQYGRLTQPPGELDARQAGFSDFAHINLAQNKVESLLRDRLRALGTEVRFDTDVVHVQNQPEGSTLTLGGRLGNGEKLRADWVLGCDGAGSTVRRSSGIKMEGPPSIARFMTIYFTADIKPYLKRDQGLLYWIGGKEARGIFISFDFDRTWAMLVPIGDLPADTFSESDAIAIVRKAIGDASAPLKLEALSSWNMSAQVADIFRKGRTFLLGDACHRFPPTGGLGMNTGIQDAHNLVWKLDAVLRGEASDALLDTYESERRPVAQRNTDQSVGNLMNMALIDQALGVPILAPVGPDAGRGPVIVYSGDEIGIDGDGAAARSRRAAVQAAIDAQAVHFGKGLGIDLGFLYEKGALIPESRPGEDPHQVAFVPDARPGKRLPHWAFADGSAMERSTLTRVARRGLTLFASDAIWVTAAKSLEGRFELTTVALPAVQAEQWTNLFGIARDGAVLVRPDGHVVWRSRTVDADPEGSLLRAARCVYPAHVG